MGKGIYNSGIYPNGGIYAEGAPGVSIDGKVYKTKKIGNLIWTIENLAVETSGSETRPSHTNFGCYYPHSDVSLIEGKLNSGWRVPSQVDFQDLVDACNSDVLAAQSTGYSLWPNATNSSGFAAVPSRTSSNSESQLDRSILWSSTITISETIAALIGSSSFQFPPYAFGENLKVCVRVCKSVKPKNLFDKASAHLIEGYCGTVGADFIIDVNHSSQRSLVVPITDEMKGKVLRFSCDLGDDVSNRWICGQVDEIPESGRTTYGSGSVLMTAGLKQSASRCFSDSIRAVGEFNYIVFFFSSGLSDLTKFINSLMICEDGNYYPYKNF